MVSCAESVY